jgi:EAL domain-containing protein (putative c-di-GMP-specific phosphodiesterase class I)
MLGEIVSGALSGAGLPASALELEVTEHIAAEELADNVELLDELRAAGVGVAIDDFGTGYSGLERLQRLRVDRLKIDKSFVRGISGGRGSPIVMATIAMAHSLGLTVVAEGVETAEQLAFLQSQGCDFAQGYLFGAPVHADDLAVMLGGDRRGQGHPAIA